MFNHLHPTSLFTCSTCTTPLAIATTWRSTLSLMLYIRTRGLPPVHSLHTDYHIRRTRCCIRFLHWRTACRKWLLCNLTLWSSLTRLSRLRGCGGISWLRGLTPQISLDDLPLIGILLLPSLAMLAQSCLQPLLFFPLFSLLLFAVCPKAHVGSTENKQSYGHV